MSARKTFTFAVTISAPAWMSKAQARREVRTLINEQCNYLDHGPDFEEPEICARKIA